MMKNSMLPSPPYTQELLSLTTQKEEIIVQKPFLCLLKKINTPL